MRRTGVHDPVEVHGQRTPVHRGAGERGLTNDGGRVVGHALRREARHREPVVVGVAQLRANAGRGRRGIGHRQRVGPHHRLGQRQRHRPPAHRHRIRLGQAHRGRASRARTPHREGARLRDRLLPKTPVEGQHQRRPVHRRRRERRRRHVHDVQPLRDGIHEAPRPALEPVRRAGRGGVREPDGLTVLERRACASRLYGHGIAEDRGGRSGLERAAAPSVEREGAAARGRAVLQPACRNTG